MSVKVEKLENSMAKLTIEVPAEELEKALDRAYNKNKNKLSIPGFRKGKAPRNIIEKMYGPEIFYEDAANDLIETEYEKAYDECGEDIVSSPEIEVVDIEKGKPFVFTATVALKPEIKLGKYKGVKIDKIETEVTDEEVDAAIEKERENSARSISVDRPVKEKDETMIDFEGFVDGVAFEGGKDEGHNLKIGSNSFIPGFEEQLIGHNIDEEFPITVTFPEDYHAENLKGKEATFQIKIHDIKVKELPELDDDFAKDVSEFDTLEEYKADILKTQTEQAEKSAQDRFENEVVKVVTENAKVDVPDCMVETEIDSMIDEQSYRMRSQGIELEMYLKYMGQTMEEYREGIRTMAASRVKTSLVLEAVGKAMNIEATDADVEEEAEKIAAQYGMKKEDFMARIKDNDQFIRDSIIGRKTVDALAEKAVKVEPKEEPKEEKEASSEE